MSTGKSKIRTGLRNVAGTDINPATADNQTSGSQATQIVDGTGKVVGVKANINTTNNELLVNLEGHECLGNRTNTPLGINGVFTGSGWQDTLDYGVLSVNISTDQASATDGLDVQWSNDGTNIRDHDKFTMLAGDSKTFTFGPAERYYRLVYTNGAVAQTAFHLNPLLRRCYVKPSSHRITDSIVGQDDAELVKSVLTGLDDTGVFRNVKCSLDGALSTFEKSSGLSIASGDVTGSSFVHKFGQAPDFDTTDNEVTVWDGANDGGINQMVYTFSATAAIDSISSSNTGDTGTVSIQGLDTNFALVTQTVTLNGQTRVALGTSLLRAFRMSNTSSATFLGEIYVYENTAITSGVPNDKTKIRIVVNGANQTLMAVYTIPAGKTGYVRDFYASTAGASKTSEYIIKLKARLYVSGAYRAWLTKHLTAISDAGTSYIKHDYIEPEVFPEKTDIIMTAQATAGGATGCTIAAGFDIVLVDN